VMSRVFWFFTNLVDYRNICLLKTLENQGNIYQDNSNFNQYWKDFISY